MSCNDPNCVECGPESLEEFLNNLFGGKSSRSQATVSRMPDGLLSALLAASSSRGGNRSDAELTAEAKNAVAAFKAEATKVLHELGDKYGVQIVDMKAIYAYVGKKTEAKKTPAEETLQVVVPEATVKIKKRRTAPRM